MNRIMKKNCSHSKSGKPLKKRSIKEMGQLFPIIIQDYTEQWIEIFKAERKQICNSFGQSEIVCIDHIGSTAIPGIKAKPTIDILLQISRQLNIKKMIRVFTSLDYQINEHPENPPPHLTFVKGYTENGFKGQSYHVHIRYEGDWDEIRFRDYLITHKEAAKEYEFLKLKLAHKYKNNREAYTNGKTHFIEKINSLTQYLKKDIYS